MAYFQKRFNQSVTTLRSRFFSKKTLPGFTLIELSIVLLVIGLIAGAIFKGQDLLESAKTRAVLNDISRFRLAIITYQETYHALPGDDPRASIHFGTGIPNGNGNGVITDREKDYFWQHLNKSGDLGFDTAPVSKLGGRYSIIFQPNESAPGHWIQLGKENGDTADGGLLTPKQALMLKSKTEESGNNNPKQGTIRFTEGSGIASGQCVQDDHLNLTVTSPVCIMIASF